MITRGLVGRELADDLHVVDSGIQVELKSGDGTDIFGHGTAIAGVIRRIAPDAEIGSIRVLGESLASRSVIIREGIRQAIDRDYRILNCSFQSCIMLVAVGTRLRVSL